MTGQRPPSSSTEWGALWCKRRARGQGLLRSMVGAWWDMKRGVNRVGHLVIEKKEDGSYQRIEVKNLRADGDITIDESGVRFDDHS